MEMREINIDIDIHKVIENGRDSFDETPNTVLRRLLGLDETGRMTKSVIKSERPWCGKRNVTLPHGTHVRMTYNGVLTSGEIVDGKWLVNGKLFGSPSAAASNAAVTRKGGKTSIDGWRYWYAKRPGDENWVALSVLYKNAFKSNK